MDTQSLPIACHGKLPSDREYVHHQVGKLAVGPFDQWVRDAHRQAFLGRATAPDAYDRAPAFGFVFPIGTGPALHGVLTPSRDATGRRYPFWVAWAAPDRAQRIDAALFQAAAAFVDKATRGDVSPDGLGAHVTRLTSRRSFRSDASLTARSMKAFVRRLLPPASPLTGRQFLGAWMRVFADRPASSLDRLTYGLQLPLSRLPNGTAGDAPDDASPPWAADLRFWREATRRLTGVPDLSMTLVWALPTTGDEEAPADRDAEVLYLFVTPAPRRLYAHLFTPTRDEAFVYAPARTTPDYAEEALTALPAAYRTLLDDLDRSPAAFLDALS